MSPYNLSSSIISNSTIKEYSYFSVPTSLRAIKIIVSDNGILISYVIYSKVSRVLVMKVCYALQRSVSVRMHMTIVQYSTGREKNRMHVHFDHDNDE